MFQNRLADMLGEDKNIIVDNGYNHEKCIILDNVTVESKGVHGRIRACHESCNERFKVLIVLVWFLDTILVSVELFSMPLQRCRRW